jgi:hypothetical protein
MAAGAISCGPTRMYAFGMSRVRSLPVWWMWGSPKSQSASKVTDYTLLCETSSNFIIPLSLLGDSIRGYSNCNTQAAELLTPLVELLLLMNPPAPEDSAAGLSWHLQTTYPVLLDFRSPSLPTARCTVL